MKKLFAISINLSFALAFALSSYAQQNAPSGWQEDGKSNDNDSAVSPARPVAAVDRPIQQPAKLMLKGQVEHSDRLPPTANELRQGADFRSSSIPTVRETSEWYRIPEWFAGTFRVEQSVAVKSYDYLNGQTTFLNQKLQTQGEETHGFQRDAHGDIWHLSTTSGTTRSEDAAHYIYNIIDWYGPEEITQGRIVMRILANTIVVGKKTGKIEGVIRREDIKTYVPLKPGAVSVSYTSKGFTPEGIPKDLLTGFSVHRQITPFRPINQMGSTDVVELFRQFLIANDLAALVPRSSGH